MAVAPVVVASGIAKLRRDLKLMGLAGAKLTREVAKGAVEPMVAIAKQQAYGRMQSGELGDAWKVRGGGTRVSMVNELDQARVLEFGGTIAPKGTPITITATHMVYGPGGAIEKGKADVERGLLTGFGRLARQHGFTGS